MKNKSFEHESKCLPTWNANVVFWTHFTDLQVVNFTFGFNKFKMLTISGAGIIKQIKIKLVCSFILKHYNN